MIEIQHAHRLSRRRFLIQSAIVASATVGSSALFSACGGSTGPSGPVTISLMDGFNATDDTTPSNHWVNVFQQQQNNQIKVTRLNFDQQRLSAMLAAGNPPDIVKSAGGPDITTWAARGLALDLTSYFQHSSVLKVDDLQPVCDFYRWDGKSQGQGARYGMPHDWSQDGMYWLDTAPFDAAGVPYPSQTTPLTYAQLLDIGKAITVRQGNKIQTYGVGTNWDYPQQLMMLLAQEGLSLYKNNDLSQMDFTQPAVQDIFQWYITWAQAHIGDSPLDSTSDWAGSLMPAKRYGMTANGLWFGGYMASTSPETRQRMRLLPAPQWGTSKRVSPCYGGTGWWVSRKSSHPDAAWKFFEFYMGGAPAVYRAKTGDGISPLKHLFNDLPGTTDYDQEATTVQKSELNYYATLQFSPYITSAAISQVLDSQIIPVMQGQGSLKTALQQVNTSVNALLQQGKGLIG